MILDFDLDCYLDVPQLVLCARFHGPDRDERSCAFAGRLEREGFTSRVYTFDIAGFTCVDVQWRTVSTSAALIGAARDVFQAYLLEVYGARLASQDPGGLRVAQWRERVACEVKRARHLRARGVL